MKNSKKTVNRAPSKNSKPVNSKKRIDSEWFNLPPNSRSISKQSSQSKSTTKKPAAKQKGEKKVESAQSGKEEERNFLPGQKHKTPDEESGALAFYKSLYQQNPHSQMAQRYCLEYGVLEYNEAKRLLISVSKKGKR